MNPDEVMNQLPQTRTMNKYVVALLLIVLYSSSLAVVAMVPGWIFGDWLFSFPFASFSIIAGVVIGVVAIILALIGLVQHRRGKIVGRDRLRVASALRAGLDPVHAAYLPAITIQPEPLSDAGDLQKRLHLQWLPNVAMVPMAVTRWRMLSVIVPIAQIAIPFFLEYVLHDDLFGTATTIQQAHALLEIMNKLYDILIVCIIVLFVCYIITVFKSKNYRITADQTDIRWQRFGRWVVVPWSSVQTIGAYTHPQSFPEDFTTTYVIAAKNRLITWKNTPGLSPGNYQSSADLLRLAVTQTGLSVRNLNPLVTALAAQATQVVAQTPQPQAMDDPQGLLGRAADLLRAELARQRHPARQLRNVAAVVLVAILATVPLLAVSYVHNVAQPTYFATLPTRIHAKAPLFQDSLRAADGHWPVQSPTQDDYRHLAYTPNGYALSGNTTGKAVYAVKSDSYGPVAIQVTATENGIIPPNTNDGVGIIMRARVNIYDPLDASNYCTFAVNYAGEWQTTCDDGYDAASGYSNAIHTGPGAANTLLVIARGNLYICYVNGEYVGQFFASSSRSFGPVGVINFESGMQATFTDFTVWSVNAPPNLDYV